MPPARVEYNNQQPVFQRSLLSMFTPYLNLRRDLSARACEFVIRDRHPINQYLDFCFSNRVLRTRLQVQLKKHSVLLIHGHSQEV
jgi:hypothetical protein